MGTKKPKKLTAQQFDAAYDEHGRWVVGEIIDTTTGMLHTVGAYTDPRAAEMHIEKLRAVTKWHNHLRVYDRRRLETRLYVRPAAPAQVGA